jgi:hypothetical protein
LDGRFHALDLFFESANRGFDTGHI